MNTAGVILNGGQSSRMGQDKSLLTIQGISLLEHSKNTLKAAGLDDVFVSGSGGIPDRIQNAGPLSGIHAALYKLEEFNSLVFIPVDMPLLKPAMLSQLMAHTDHDMVHYEGKHFPIMMKNIPAVRDLITQQLKQNKLAIHQLIKSASCQSLPHNWSEDCFANTNTQEQWHSVLAQIKNHQ